MENVSFNLIKIKIVLFQLKNIKFNPGENSNRRGSREDTTQPFNRNVWINNNTNNSNSKKYFYKYSFDKWPLTMNILKTILLVPRM